VAPEDSGLLRVSDAVQQYIARKRLAGKRPATIVSYTTNLNLFKDWCPRLYIDEITGEDLLSFAAF
jgi:nucleoside-specific outer membrane channel protein Tsx